MTIQNKILKLQALTEERSMTGLPIKSSNASMQFCIGDGKSSQTSIAFCYNK
ncbi:hypothetical protein [Staphylococcus simulans]|uniref:hypothetical protein n=1 Tax=Staphylococcus simulans TaxID=1286 RepID=UPI00131F0510|nr:hypothetical protein [Staphylococcus simulans]